MVKGEVIICLVCMSSLVVHTQRILFELILRELVTQPEITANAQCIPKNKTELIQQFSNPNITISPEWSTVWTKSQGDIFTLSFFLGYFVMQLPGGYIGDKFGVRYLYTTSILISSIVVILIATVTDCEQHELIATFMFIFGFSQASIYPNTATLISKWVTPRNYAKTTGCAYSMISLGYVFSRKDGYIYTYVPEWRTAFYIWGGAGLGCYIFCIILVFSEPSKDPHVGEQEKKNLQEHIAASEKHINLKIISPGICHDAAVPTMILAQIAHNFNFFFVVTYAPQYYQHVLISEMYPWDHFEMLLLPVGLGSGICADMLIYRKNFKPIKIRKTYVMISLATPGVLLAAMPYIGCKGLTVTIIRIIAIFATGFHYSGFKANVIDVTHNFSGTLMGLLGTLGTVMDFSCYLILKSQTPKNTFKQWEVLLWMPFVCSVIASLVFFVLATGERRKWDQTPNQ